MNFLLRYTEMPSRASSIKFFLRLEPALFVSIFSLTFSDSNLHSSQGQTYPSKIHLWIYYLKNISIGSCWFQVHLCIPACVISIEFTCEVVMNSLPAQVSWIRYTVNVSKAILSTQRYFNLTENREIIVKNSLLIMLVGMQIWIWIRQQQTTK